ncbi:MAG: HAD family hydrolase [Dysgonomonas sp.]|uniref:HAD family hydrolase n=1 Tax=Dysgonomonas sp. GY75 TaxID=2780419 RepID=UPI0018833F3A|nr:HAD family hydrolase [Dysgonomonas sp. GY75]MBF0650085.1 haloacid dehalogenase-like hydrolase [Dysgonomonas sp. GY75]
MAKKTKKIIALIYDFDGTLSPGNMQEFGFMKAIGNDKRAFWSENTQLSTQNDASEILCYMHLMIKYANSKNISLKRTSFQSFGKDIELFKGVEEWFSLINEYGKSKGVIIEHYINSSGLKEIIEGTPIAKEFKNIFACSYMYDVDGRAHWPAVAVDYTAKTQFLFKINKGIESVRDNKEINKYVPEQERKIPFRHMIYFGDGETDIPCMKLIKQQGGHSIAVYKPRDRKKKTVAEKLINENRVNFVCSADYSQDKEMYKVVTKIIDRIVSEVDFTDLLAEHKEKAKESNTTQP